MFDFLLRFGAIQTELGSILNEKFLPGQKDSQISDYLYDTQMAILRHHNFNKYHKRDYNLLRLEMFLKHLKTIEEKDPDLLGEFRTELKKEDYDNYYGTRFEMDMAASLLEKGVDFAHPDPPDFVIKGTGVESSIECTMSHFSGGDRTIEEKFKQSLISKSGADYDSSNTALFIDITNLNYHAVDSGTEFTESQIKYCINEAIENFNIDFGSALVFVYIIERRGDTPGIGHHYWRVEYQNPEDTLIDFLDEYYPYSNTTVDEPYHPHDP